jgi:hypothetical protein
MINTTPILRIPGGPALSKEEMKCMLNLFAILDCDVLVVNHIVVIFERISLIFKAIIQIFITTLYILCTT